MRFRRRRPCAAHCSSSPHPNVFRSLPIDDIVHTYLASPIRVKRPQTWRASFGRPCSCCSSFQGCVVALPDEVAARSHPVRPWVERAVTRGRRRGSSQHAQPLPEVGSADGPWCADPMGAPHRHARRWSHDRMDVAASGPLSADHHGARSTASSSPTASTRTARSRHPDVAAELLCSIDHPDGATHRPHAG
jgi:hypothetical protein